MSTVSQLDLGELASENQRLKDQGGGDFLKNFVKLPEGNGHVVIRFLAPAPSGMFDRTKNPFFVGTRVHRVNNKSFHCPRVLTGASWKGQCPICDYYSHLWKESEKKTDKEEIAQLQAQARAIKPIERYYYNCIVRSQFNDETGQMEKNVGPLILSVGKTIHSMIIRAIVGDETLEEKPLGDITHALTGRDFKLIKTMRQSGSENYPNYSTSKFLDPSPLGNPDEVEKWYVNLHDLVSLRTVKPLEELKHELKVHLGLVRDTNSAFDPTEYQNGSSVANVSAKTTVTVDKEVTANAAAADALLGGDDEGPMPESDFYDRIRNLGG